MDSPSGSSLRGGGEQDSSPDRHVFKRTRSGCLTCRSRRVKCDESRPMCSNCRRVAAVCAWPNDSNSLSLHSPDVPPLAKRIRPSRRQPTCRACQTAKCRCSHTPPTCERCDKQGIRCVWPKDTDDIPSSSSAYPPNQNARFVNGASALSLDSLASAASEHAARRPTNTSPAILPYRESVQAQAEAFTTEEQLLILLRAYFKHVHPVQAMAFLQQAQLFRDTRDGVASPLLLKSICAVAYRFTNEADPNHPDGGVSPARWVQEAKDDLMSDMDRISLSKLAATLCILHHEFNSGRLLSAWILMALAARMALAMGLDSERKKHEGKAKSATPWLTEEIARRLMWSTLCFDALGSFTFKKYTLINGKVDIPLPANEHFFRLGTAPPLTPASLETVESVSVPETESELHHQNDGFMARWVRLMTMRRSILSYAALAHCDGPKPWEPGSRFFIFRDQLDAWQTTLPPYLAYNLENLHARHGSGELGSLVGLHLLYDLIRHSFLRIAFTIPPGPSHEAMFQGSPPDFMALHREEAYQNGLSIQARLKDVDEYFPEYISSSRLWTRSVHASLRIQLEHLAVEGFLGATSEPDTVNGFKVLLRTVAKMTRYFSGERRFARDMLDLLSQYGFDLYSSIGMEAVATRPGSPSIPQPFGEVSARGRVLSDIPWMRRGLRHPDVEEDLGQPKEGTHTENVDPITNTVSTGTQDPPFNHPQSGPPIMPSDLVPSATTLMPNLDMSLEPGTGALDIGLNPFTMDQPDSLLTMWTQFHREDDAGPMLGMDPLQDDPHLWL